MNIERFAGDNEILKKMGVDLQRNAQQNEARKREVMNLALSQRDKATAAAYGRII